MGPWPHQASPEYCRIVVIQIERVLLIIQVCFWAENKNFFFAALHLCGVGQKLTSEDQGIRYVGGS